MTALTCFTSTMGALKMVRGLITLFAPLVEATGPFAPVIAVLRGVMVLALTSVALCATLFPDHFGTVFVGTTASLYLTSLNSRNRRDVESTMLGGRGAVVRMIRSSVLCGGGRMAAALPGHADPNGQQAGFPFEVAVQYVPEGQHTS